MNDEHRHNVNRLIHDLEHGDETTRRFAAEDIEFGKNFEAIPALSKGLGDSSIAVAEACSAALIAIGGEAVAEAIVSNLGSEDVRLRNLTSEVLSGLGDAAVPILANQLQSLDRDVRKFAVDSLLMIRSEASMKALVVALDDNDVNIAATAADGLGEIGTANHLEILATYLTTEDQWMKCAVVRGIASIGGPKALRLVRPYLNDEDMVVRITSIQGLGKIGLVDSAQALLEMLALDDLGFYGGEVVTALYQVLGQLERDHFPSVEPVQVIGNLSRLVVSGASDQRMKAIEMFSILNLKDYAEALIPALGDDNEDLRELALQCLEKLAPQNLQPFAVLARDTAKTDLERDGAIRVIASSILPERDALLLEALQSADKVTIKGALSYLPINVGPALSRELAQHLTSEDLSLRLATALAMGRLAAPEFIPLLVPRLQIESEQDIKDAIDNALIQIGSSGSNNSIAPYIQSFTQEERSIALELYGYENPVSRQKEIIASLGDQHTHIRVIGLKVLANLKLLTLPIVEHALADEDPTVQVEAIRGLALLNLGDQLIPTLKSYVEYGPVKYERVQVELIQLLVRSGLLQALEIIKPFLHSPSTWIKIEAVEGLRAIGNSSVLPDLQELMDDADEDLLEALEQAIYELEG